MNAIFRTCCGALLGSLVPTTVVAAAPADWNTHRADARVSIQQALVDESGLSIEFAGAKRGSRQDDYERWSATLRGDLRFVIEAGHYAVPASGRLTGLRAVFRADGRSRDVELSLVARARSRGVLSFVDGDGAEWLHAKDVHQRFDAADGELEMAYLDLRAGEALAQWLRRPGFEGRLVGGLHVTFSGSSSPSLAKGNLECRLQAQWPVTTPGGITDVVVDRISQLDIPCPGATCDGAGTQSSAFVKFLPSVRLANAGNTDVPWFPKFQGEATQRSGGYPYATLDQHPFLVWNIYRIEADGRIEQIARSGVKHAFFSGNEPVGVGPGCPCNGDTVLGFGPRPGAPSSGQCADTYDAFSNDQFGALGPRREVLAYQGIFGRCGSIFDPDCDGSQNQVDSNPEPTNVRYRARLHESALVAAQHPGARWYIESWYIVRDDANLFNTMGNREFVPAFAGSAWQATFPGSETIPNGAVIDRWVSPASVAPDARNTLVATAKGRLKLAVRVVALPDSRWRYDYAVMNFDYADPATTGAEPNLRVTSNAGIGAVRIPLPAVTSNSASEFSDGGTTTADDWNASRAGGELVFAAPAGNTLDWGSMYRYSFVANAAPVEGTVTLDPADATAADLPVATLVPGASAVLFADGFEAP